MTASHFHLSDSLHQRPSNSTLLVAVVWIINHIYAGYTSSLTFSLWSRTVAGDSLQTELLSEILSSVRDTELTYVIENSAPVQCGGDSDAGGGGDDASRCLLREAVFLMVDSLEAFMRFKEQIGRRNFAVNGFYSIIYTGQLRSHYEAVVRILQELFAVYVTNVNIYVELPQETLVYSYFPFTEYHCHVVSPVVHNRFTMEDGFLYSKPFFAAKDQDFYGCAVTVATWSGPPFVFFTKGPGGELYLHGVEGEILRLLAVKMNFTIKALDADRRGWVFSNLTTTGGAVKLVMDGVANVTINSFLYSKNYLRTMLASYSYTSYPIVVAVPRGKSLSSFQRLTRPFKYIIWSCLSASLLAGITIIFVIKCLQKRSVSDFVFGPLNVVPFSNLLNIFFGGQVTVIPRRNFARYILLVWLLYTMVLRNAYTGELFIMLQDSTSRTHFQSIEELVANNYTIVCSDNTLDVLLGSTHARHMEVIRGLPFRYLRRLQDPESNLAVVLLRPYLRLYNEFVRGKPPIRTLPRALVTVHLTMYFRRNSYLARPANKYLLAFMAAGMMKVWDRIYLPSEEVMQEEVGGEPATLSVQLLKGLFVVYLICLGVSLLVFGLELWSRHSPICRAVIRFFNY